MWEVEFIRMGTWVFGGCRFFLEESTYGSDDDTIKVSLRSAVGK